MHPQQQQLALQHVELPARLHTIIGATGHQRGPRERRAAAFDESLWGTCWLSCLRSVCTWSEVSCIALSSESVSRRVGMPNHVFCHTVSRMDGAALSQQCLRVPRR